MKTMSFAALLLALVAVMRLYAQAPAASEQEQELLRLVQQVQGEHAQIADNQAKLEVKAQEIAETVKSARFLAARSGGSHVQKSP